MPLSTIAWIFFFFFCWCLFFGFNLLVSFSSSIFIGLFTATGNSIVHRHLEFVRPAWVSTFVWGRPICPSEKLEHVTLLRWLVFSHLFLGSITVLCLEEVQIWWQEILHFGPILLLTILQFNPFYFIAKLINIYV